MIVVELENGAQDQPLAYRVADAAKLLAISTSKAWELVARGDLKSFKIDGSRRVSREAVEEYVKSRSG